MAFELKSTIVTTEKFSKIDVFDRKVDLFLLRFFNAATQKQDCECECPLATFIDPSNYKYQRQFQ